MEVAGGKSNLSFGSITGGTFLPPYKPPAKASSNPLGLPFFDAFSGLGQSVQDLFMGSLHSTMDPATKQVEDFLGPSVTGAVDNALGTGDETSSLPSSLADWTLPRLAVIILGFIFVAVGLSFFRESNPSAVIVKTVKAAA